MPAGAASPRIKSTRWTLLALALILLFTAAVRSRLLYIPLERDEGEYAYIAWRLDYGELPYRDWVDQKPPAIFWAYRMALALPIDPVYAVHLAGLLFAAGSACALFLLARRFVSPGWATVAAMLLALYSADTRVQGQAANTELFMLLPLILAQLAFYRASEGGRGRIGFMIACGVLTGLASAFKQVAAVNWLFLIALFPFFTSSETRLRRSLQFAGASTLGAAAVWGSISLYFFLRHGFDDFIFNVFTHNFHYISNVTWEWRRIYLLNTLSDIYKSQTLVWVFSLAGLAVLFRRRELRPLLFLGGWLLSSVPGVSASGYFFPHYFQQLLPVLALTATLGAESVCRWDWWNQKVPALAIKAVLGLVFLLPPAYSLYPFVFKYSPMESIRDLYPQTLFAEMPELGRRVAQVTKPEDRIFVFGAEPELYFFAKRASASRYIFLFPLYGRYADALDRQKAAAEEITRNHPAAFISIPLGILYGEGTEQYFTHWSENFVAENYGGNLYLTVNNYSPEVKFIDRPTELKPNSEPIIAVVFLRTKP